MALILGPIFLSLGAWLEQLAHAHIAPRAPTAVRSSETDFPCTEPLIRTFEYVKRWTCRPYGTWGLFSSHDSQNGRTGTSPIQQAIFLQIRASYIALVM